MRSGCGFGDEERRVRRGLCLGGDGGGDVVREEEGGGGWVCYVACQSAEL